VRALQTRGNACLVERGLSHSLSANRPKPFAGFFKQYSLFNRAHVGTPAPRQDRCHQPAAEPELRGAPAHGDARQRKRSRKAGPCISLWGLLTLSGLIQPGFQVTGTPAPADPRNRTTPPFPSRLASGFGAADTGVAAPRHPAGGRRQASRSIPCLRQ